MRKWLLAGGTAAGAAVIGAALGRTLSAQAPHIGESVDQYEHAGTRILILGAGFGGMMTARRLSSSLERAQGTSVLLVDRGNSLLFYPLLWTVADGRADPNGVVMPLRAFQRGRSFHVLHAEIQRIDLDKREVHTSAGVRPYDVLVLGLGSVTAVPEITGLRERALLFHSPADALQLRNHIIDAIEIAHQCEDREDRKAWLTFVVGGGGDTGCELAATIRDYAANGLLKQYPWLTDTPPRVVVVERMNRLMPLAREEVSARVTRILADQGVEAHTDAAVERVTADTVYTTQGEIRSHTLFWAAGTTAPEVVRAIEAGHERNGSLIVDGHLRIPEHPEVYVVGDAAWICDPESGAAVPPTAQAAEQEGQYVARVIAAQLAGTPLPPPFHYSSRGHLTLLGSHTAIGEIGPAILTGPLAWLLWHGYYLVHIPAWRNRLHLGADWLLAALAGRETGQLRLDPTAPPRSAGRG